VACTCHLSSGLCRALLPCHLIYPTEKKHTNAGCLQNVVGTLSTGTHQGRGVQQELAERGGAVFPRHGRGSLRSVTRVLSRSPWPDSITCLTLASTSSACTCPCRHLSTSAPTLYSSMINNLFIGKSSTDLGHGSPL
jgi:hypothetical protein